MSVKYPEKIEVRVVCLLCKSSLYGKDTVVFYRVRDWAAQSMLQHSIDFSAERTYHYGVQQ